MVKKVVVLRKRTVPKVVNLPNGKSFISNWERTSQKKLPTNIKVERRKTISPRKNNRKGIAENLIKTGFNLGSKAITSELGKKLINKGIDNIPNIFKFGVSKIKNKKIQDALSSDIAEIVVDEAQNRAKNSYSTLFD